MNLLRYDTPEGILAFSTGRDCGIEALGLKLEDMVLPRQVHSSNVLWMREAGRPERTDAVITDVPGLCVCVKTADCIPVLLYDTRHGVVAAAHAGWRGTVSRIVVNTLELMGSVPSDVHAIIGPGISQEAFEVGDEVYQTFLNAGFPMAQIAIHREKWHLDLWHANAWLLEQWGVSDIYIAGECTYKEADRYYSARRETINTGRNLNGIMLIP